MMLHIKNISLTLGKMPILKDISFAASAGELCVIMGANGAGKSSLLNVIAGEYPAYKGDVRIAGEELRKIPIAQQATTRAVLSQHVVLNQPFSVQDVAAMGRFVYSRHLDALDKEIVMCALKTMQVYDLRNRPYPTLSGGQKQRVQMARVLAQLLEAPGLQELDYTGKKMLLLDEPVTGMDILHEQLSLQLATTLASAGVLVVAVLHDFQLAAAFAHRILLLKAGALYTGGTVDEVLTAAHIKNSFGVDVTVLSHPQCNYPLVVTAATAGLFQSPAGKALNVF
ncbi:ATP-binding cassette domain-containing protein [Chitinophaga sancti]|uniref:ATP-binding cassette domain-containing protein n=1 Tax=Chitinophaga sancti TaxID=1004 RepID=A0A1K1PH96_9BACT|nr:ATP-binding cassette domain-containing protein [Chitinophaga sancti]WQD59418.1 ATP-binding cassette domain-containing protein [Chitinophaga sancti]WQG88448.1 ATP-binding cassette domain-containing protein [Chitinophaga sancti]SFW47168.1 iron complex transport system ATP-binding protein [Chitinophaga sancti]